MTPLVLYFWGDGGQRDGLRVRKLNDVNRALHPLVINRRKGPRGPWRGDYSSIETGRNLQIDSTSIAFYSPRKPVLTMVYRLRQSGLHLGRVQLYFGTAFQNRNVPSPTLEPYLEHGCNVPDSTHTPVSPSLPRELDQYDILRTGGVSTNVVEVMVWLVEHKKMDLNMKGDHGWTALHFAAACCNSLEVVRWLVEQGMDVQDEDGRTAIHCAASSGADVVRWLVDQREMNVNERDNGGRTVFHHAAGSGALKVLDWLAEEKEVDVNVTDNTGRTALHYAVTSGDLEIIRWLVEKGTDVNGAGELASHYAARKGELGILKWLVKVKGVDVDTQNDAGDSALHVAQMNGV